MDAKKTSVFLKAKRKFKWEWLWERTACERTAVAYLWNKSMNNSTGQRLEEFLPSPASRVSLGLEKTFTCAQTQLVNLRAADWVQLCISAGCPWNKWTMME